MVFAAPTIEEQPELRSFLLLTRPWYFRAAGLLVVRECSDIRAAEFDGPYVTLVLFKYGCFHFCRYVGTFLRFFVSPKFLQDWSMGKNISVCCVNLWLFECIFVVNVAHFLARHTQRYTHTWPCARPAWAGIQFAVKEPSLYLSRTPPSMVSSKWSRNCIDSAWNVVFCARGDAESIGTYDATVWQDLVNNRRLNKAEIRPAQFRQRRHRPSSPPTFILLDRIHISYRVYA